MSYPAAPSYLSLHCLEANITFEALAAEGDAPAVPRFSMVAYSGEPLRVEGWRFPVVVDLEGLSIPSQRRPVRYGQRPGRDPGDRPRGRG